MLNDYRNKAVLITGGTMGIGLETALQFARAGAHCFITYRWGSADLDKVTQLFKNESLPLPAIVESNVADLEDINDLLNLIQKEHDRIDAFISNVSFALLTKNLSDYSEKGLNQSLAYTVWPVVEYIREIHKIFGTYPRYVIGLSSNGPDQYHTNYDFVAVAKALLETIIKYLNYHLFNEDIRINVLRARFVKTESLWATCGKEFEEFGEKYTTPGLFIEANEVAQGIFALCSGLMDGISGQTLTLDKGSTFADNIMRYYDERNNLNL